MVVVAVERSSVVTEEAIVDCWPFIVVDESFSVNGCVCVIVVVAIVV